jgi:hypothetical protein
MLPFVTPTFANSTLLFSLRFWIPNYLSGYSLSNIFFLGFFVCETPELGVSDFGGKRGTPETPQ